MNEQVSITKFPSFLGLSPILGLDAEVLPIRNGELVWPHQVKGMNQWRPKGRSVWKVPNRGDWHGDGFAFEFCTTPAACLDEGLLNASHVMFTLASRLEDSQMVAPALYDVPKHIAETAPDDVRKLGCAPSFNIYGDEACPEVLGSYTRSTGCHLHVSHKDLNQELVAPLLQWADILVGVPWTYISPEDPRLEAKRRMAYGRAGEHRRNIYPKPRQLFGVEYRVLPGRPATHPVYLTLMWRLYRWALYLTFADGAPASNLVERARDAINNANAEKAEGILKEVNLTDRTRAILAHLKKHPFAPLTPAEWYHQGSGYNGVCMWAGSNIGR